MTSFSRSKTPRLALGPCFCHAGVKRRQRVRFIKCRKLQYVISKKSLISIFLWLYFCVGLCQKFKSPIPLFLIPFRYKEYEIRDGQGLVNRLYKAAGCRILLHDGFVIVEWPFHRISKDSFLPAAATLRRRNYYREMSWQRRRQLVLQLQTLKMN